MMGWMQKSFGQDYAVTGAAGMRPQTGPCQATPPCRTEQVSDTAAPGGGLIIGSSNSILPGTPAKNMLAMYDAAREYAG